MHKLLLVVKPSATNGPDGYTFLAYYQNNINYVFATTLATVNLNGYVLVDLAIPELLVVLLIRMVKSI